MREREREKEREKEREREREDIEKIMQFINLVQERARYALLGNTPLNTDSTELDLFLKVVIFYFESYVSN